MSNEVISIGVDIGTTTTHLVLSKLVFSDTANCFSVHHVSLVETQVIYRSEIYFTPLVGGKVIDVNQLKKILQAEMKKANIDRQDIKTGAVIITGEAARKSNSEAVSLEMSDFIGDFVVATAGPDLEAVIAGKGSGACTFSSQQHETVMNLDIGGGTTNVVVFEDGKILRKGCWDIGGRMIRFDTDGKITHLSQSARQVIQSLALEAAFEIGQCLSDEALGFFVEKITQLMKQIIGIEAKENLLDLLETRGSSKFDSPAKLDGVSFSGGVAEAIYENREMDPYLYGDIGMIIGTSIRKNIEIKAIRQVIPQERIRATVVGAGSHTTHISGSTIYVDEKLLPMKNIPVIRIPNDIERSCFQGRHEPLLELVSWTLSQTDDERVALSFTGKPDITYEEVSHLASALAKVHQDRLKDQPLIVCFEKDIAKAVGFELRNHLGQDINVICIDSIQVDQGDYMDFGKPIVNHLVIPVVVKTLIFG